jgi:hypothetical protein
MNNVYITLGLLILLFSSPVITLEVTPNPSKAEKTEICPSLKYLFNDSKMERFEIFENTNPHLCPELEKTCCTKQDFIAIQNWWQTNKVNNNSCSRQGLRQKNTNSIIYYTKVLLRNFKNFELLAKTIIKEANGPSEFCLNAAKNIEPFFSSNLFKNKTFIKSIEESQVKCFELTNKLQLNVLCGLCSTEMDKTIDLKNKKITLNTQSCLDLSSKCKDIIHTNLNIIYPYLKHLEPLLRCSADGDFDKS